MLVSEYDLFVQRSDRSTGKPREIALDIATYGLAGEIGSVVAALKKRLLAESGTEEWNRANDEIIEELGDVIWYCFSLARTANPTKPVNIFAHDIANLRAELSGSDKRADRIRELLDSTKQADFLEAATEFPRQAKKMVFEDYQKLAFLTARTSDRTLVEVCIAVLWQLSAQLLRRKLPDIEKDLNQAIVERETNDLLGEIAWHIAALASVYGLEMSEIAEKNVEKLSFRLDRDNPTPRHDEDAVPSQQFPRNFEVSVVTVAKGRARMYVNGKQLGNDLTDNAREDDGYRYHDIMHLANLAKLGWSPVLRDLMGRKRKGHDLTDEVEDGARAGIMEEAVISAIHSEGVRLSSLKYGPQAEGPVRLFSSPDDISFSFLKLIHAFVKGREVWKNRYWEWEEAILAGHDIFYRLRCEGQGTISLDLNARSISFRPEVCVDLDGSVSGLGSAFLREQDEGQGWSVTELNELELRGKSKISEIVRLVAQKRAVLNSLGIQQHTPATSSSLTITELGDGRISVKAGGEVQQAMWSRQVVGFKTSSASQGDGIYCTAIAVVDN